MIAAKAPGVAAVTVIEANPDLVPVIRETHRLNSTPNVDLRNAVVAGAGGPPVPFYLRADFWVSSSMEADSRPFVRV